MEPAEAISLLDAKFPDERVRAYAVGRVAHLSDDALATYMLQLSQGLLYEEQHWSPLSEMLIERSLRNPYIVGQAFYWTLKGNLFQKPMYERYYLLLEQFLMLCGKFRRELQVQQSVNDTFVKVMDEIIRVRYGAPEAKELPWQVDLHAIQQAKKTKKLQKKNADDDDGDILTELIKAKESEKSNSNGDVKSDKEKEKKKKKQSTSAKMKITARNELRK
jgi:hypothetical protein